VVRPEGERVRNRGGAREKGGTFARKKGTNHRRDRIGGSAQGRLRPKEER